MNINEIAVKSFSNVLVSSICNKSQIKTNPIEVISSYDFNELFKYSINELMNVDIDNFLIECSNSLNCDNAIQIFENYINHNTDNFLSCAMGSLMRMKLSKLKNDKIHSDITGNYDLSITPIEFKKIFTGAIETGLKDCMIESFIWKDDMTIVNGQGKILKRFSKHIKKEHSIILSNESMGLIGSRLESLLNDSIEEYTYDIFKCSNGINWYDGQFGKSGSCYYGLYKNSIPTIEHNEDMYAIRFFEDMDDMNGIGRTWFKVLDEDTIIIFNSYGINQKNVLSVIKSIALKNGIKINSHTSTLINSESNYIPYINNDKGLLISSNSIDSIDEIDLNLIEYDNFMNEWILGNECDNCGEYVNEDMNEINGCSYCNSCYEDNFSECELCNGVHSRHSMLNICINHSNESTMICTECEDNLNKCGVCNGYMNEDEDEDICDVCKEVLIIRKEYNLKVGYNVLFQSRFDLINAGQLYFDVSTSTYNYELGIYNKILTMRGFAINVNED